MPTILDNKQTWDGSYNWKDRGDEWSENWGGPFMQWYGTIFPRIKTHVPTKRILEIACGYGRWTQYLKDLCEQLTLVDLSEECIHACQQRFSGSKNIAYHVNDGKSLDMIDDNSIDFVFSYDSLVHANDVVIETYLSQLRRILSSDGACFIHHSNLGEYRTLYSRLRKVPKLEETLVNLGVLDKTLHWRDANVDSSLVESLAKKYGLRCITQEITQWGFSKAYTDCMSTIVRDDSPVIKENTIYRNSSFSQEIRNLSELTKLYGPAKM